MIVLTHVGLVTPKYVTEHDHQEERRNSIGNALDLRLTCTNQLTRDHELTLYNQFCGGISSSQLVGRFTFKRRRVCQLRISNTQCRHVVGVGHGVLLALVHFLRVLEPADLRARLARRNLAFEGRDLGADDLHVLKVADDFGFLANCDKITQINLWYFSIVNEGGHS